LLLQPRPLHHAPPLAEKQVMWIPEQVVRVARSTPQRRETITAPKVPQRFERSAPEQTVMMVGNPAGKNIAGFLTPGASVYAQAFMSSLIPHLPENPRTKTTSRTPDELREQLVGFLAQYELASNTKNNYARSMGEFQRFLMAVHMTPTNYSAALFIVDLFYDEERRETLTINGLYQYAKDVSAACGQGRCESWAEEGIIYLPKVMKILYNMGATVPLRQAKPMTFEHAYLALKIPGWTEEERLTVYAMWKTASRDVDIVTLSASDCRKEVEAGETLIVFEWIPKENQSGAGSGRTKNSHGKVLTCVVNAKEHTERLWKYIEKRKKAKKPFTSLTEEQIIKVLQRLDPEYTGHSPKRGALNHLGRNKVGFELIGRMARHHQPGRDLPKTTELYLDPAIYGLMGRTQDATRLL